MGGAERRRMRENEQWAGHQSFPLSTFLVGKHVALAAGEGRCVPACACECWSSRPGRRLRRYQEELLD